MADCRIWRLEANNLITRETRTYKFYLGDEKDIDIPWLKKYKCSFFVDNGGASLGCSPIKSMDNITIITSSACVDGHSSPATMIINGIDKKTTGFTAATFIFVSE